MSSSHSESEPETPFIGARSVAVGKEQRVVQNIVKFNPQIHDRVSANLHLYHQQDFETPYGVNPIFSSVYNKTDEQPYERTHFIDESVQQLDVGWLKDQKISFILIENLSGKQLLKQPTKEERDELEKQIIFYGPENNLCFQIKPKQFNLISPVDGETLFIKSNHGK